MKNIELAETNMNAQQDFAAAEHEFCVVDGDLFVDGQFAAQLCWDAAMTNAALEHYLNADPAERTALNEGYEYSKYIRTSIENAPKYAVQRKNGILAISLATYWD